MSKGLKQLDTNGMPKRQKSVWLCFVVLCPGEIQTNTSGWIRSTKNFRARLDNADAVQAPLQE